MKKLLLIICSICLLTNASAQTVPNQQNFVELEKFIGKKVKKARFFTKFITKKTIDKKAGEAVREIIKSDHHMVHVLGLSTEKSTKENLKLLMSDVAISIMAETANQQGLTVEDLKSQMKQSKNKSVLGFIFLFPFYIVALPFLIILCSTTWEQICNWD